MCGCGHCFLPTVDSFCAAVLNHHSCTYEAARRKAISLITLLSDSTCRTFGANVSEARNIPHRSSVELRADRIYSSALPERAVEVHAVTSPTTVQPHTNLDLT